MNVEKPVTWREAFWLWIIMSLLYADLDSPLMIYLNGLLAP